jgi:uncharacterized protein (DUF1330 family)
MPAGYVIADIEVKDPEAYADYRGLSTAAAEKHGGEFLVRGGATETLEGGWQPSRFVIIRFESVEAARRWYESPDYSEARAVRQRAAESTLLLAEGI